jgi:hypothetical protein
MANYLSYVDDNYAQQEKTPLAGVCASGVDCVPPEGSRSTASLRVA